MPGAGKTKDENVGLAERNPPLTSAAFSVRYGEVLLTAHMEPFRDQLMGPVMIS